MAAPFISRDPGQWRAQHVDPLLIYLESACAGLPSKTTQEATSRRALGPVESSGGELGPDKIALETPNIDTRE
jgi:hypothetical protein